MLSFLFSRSFSRVIKINGDISGSEYVTPSEPVKFVFNNRSYKVIFENSKDFNIISEKCEEKSTSADGKATYYTINEKSTIEISSKFEKSIDFIVKPSSNSRKLLDETLNITIKFSGTHIESGWIKNVDSFFFYANLNTRLFMYIENSTYESLQTFMIDIKAGSTSTKFSFPYYDVFYSAVPSTSLQMSSVMLKPTEFFKAKASNAFITYCNDIYYKIESISNQKPKCYYIDDSSKTSEFTLDKVGMKYIKANSVLCENYDYLKITPLTSSYTHFEFLVNPYVRTTDTLNESMLHESDYYEFPYLSLQKTKSDDRNYKLVPKERIVFDSYSTIRFDDYTDKKCDYYQTNSVSMFGIHEVKPEETYCFLVRKGGYTHYYPHNYQVIIKDEGYTHLDLYYGFDLSSSQRLLKKTLETDSITEIECEFLIGIIYNSSYKDTAIRITNFSQYSEIKGYIVDIKSTEGHQKIIVIVYVVSAALGAFILPMFMWCCCASYCCPCSKPKEFIDYQETLKKEAEEIEKLKANNDQTVENSQGSNHDDEQSLESEISISYDSD